MTGRLSRNFWIGSVQNDPPDQAALALSISLILPEKGAKLPAFLSGKRVPTSGEQQL
jgi:hypothetical protein